MGLTRPIFDWNLIRYRAVKDRARTAQYPTYIAFYREDWVVLDALDNKKIEGL